MPGVQSFVAQRQQNQLDPTRQVVGAQHRVPVPMTKLENTQQKPSVPKPSPDLPAGTPAAGSRPCSSRKQSVEAPAVPSAFDTDVESADDTVTMSIGGSIWGHQGEGDDREQTSSQYDVGVATPGAQVFSQCGQEQPPHIHRFRQPDAEGSEEEDNEESYEESADEEADEELVRDGILQDLNSPGFSRYLQGETSHTAHATFQPVMATPKIHSSLASKDVMQHSRKLANPFASRGKFVNAGAADANVNPQRASRRGHERTMKQTSAVPVREFQSTSVEQPSVSAQHRKASDHHELSQQPSVPSQQTLRFMSRARVGKAQDIVATNVQPQDSDGKPPSVQNGSMNVGDDKSSVDWNPEIDRIHDRKPTVSADCPQTRKRARDLDHSPDQLSSMTFQQLSNEPFDLASDIARASVPQELSSGTLAAKMDYILERLKDDDTKLLQRRAFFSSLSIEQYEECANVMIRRFTDIVSTVTDARQQRRRAAKDFEEKVAKREECVRGKTTDVDKDLGRLKRGGEEVVRSAAV